MGQTISFSKPKFKSLIVPLGIVTAVIFGWLTAQLGFLVPGILVLLAVTTSFLIMVFRKPRTGFIATLLFCFLLFILIREVGGLAYGIGIEVLLLLTWLGVLFNSSHFDWQVIKNDLCYLTFIWFAINLLELANPAGASVMGWVQEVRSTSVYFVLIVPLCFLIFNTKKDLRLFIILIIGLSVLGAFNAFRQAKIGLSPGELEFLSGQAGKTHLLFGKLRAFSFYSDAGQFGASQAHIALIALIMVLAPIKWWQRVLLLIAAGILIYGMLLSGTRGALFVLIVGGATAVFLTKQVRLFLIGTFIMLSAFYVLKYTIIAESYYEVRRLRSALNPEDASLNVRLINQEILAEYLKTRPFGGGLGVIGTWGPEYNPNNFLAHIPPDSYWVKVWAMYGIVGFIIWFGMMLFIIGKCCGIVWNIRDQSLRIKLMALTAGTVGILFASYGNEVINTMPSSIIVYISWAFVFMGPKFDRQSQNLIEVKHD